MWMMTTEGFVSIVNKGGGLQVRSRDRRSIEAFCRDAGVDQKRIITGGGTDYQFRVIRVAKKDVKRFMSKQVDEIKYRNFKDAAKARRGKVYAGALMSVWSTMWRLAPRGAYEEYFRPKQSKALSLPAVKTGKVESVHADPQWWYDHFPRRAQTTDIPTITELMEMDEVERHETLVELDIQAREMEDDEIDDLLNEVERRLEVGGKKSHWDMTQEEWEKYCESGDA